MNEGYIREFSEALSYLNRLGKIQECFFAGHDTCKGKIKQGHSIQKNGRLSLLESDIKGQRSLYSLGKFDISDSYGHPMPKLIGKKEASTFMGFCGHHDKTLFAPIEDEIQILSAKQLFLHSYRSFAYWYHTKKELLFAITKESKFNLIASIDDNFFESNIQLAVESELAKSELNKSLVSHSFNQLNYYVHKISQTHLIASSDVVIPYYYLNDETIYGQTEYEMYAKIMLTVLPDEKGTIIIMACLRDDIKATQFIEDFKKLPSAVFEDKISSLLIYSRGNTFFSPKIWDQISDLDKASLLSELNNILYEESTGDTLFNGYFNSSVNLFSYPQ